MTFDLDLYPQNYLAVTFRGLISDVAQTQPIKRQYVTYHFSANR